MCYFMLRTNVKKLGYVANINELKAGDILLFRKPFSALDKSGCMNKFNRAQIMLAGAFFNQENGHYDTTHAGICVGIDSKGNVLIAHLTGHEIMGYKKEPLKDMLQRDGGDRAFVIYRPRSFVMSQAVTTIASDEANQSIRWDKIAALSMFVKFPKLRTAKEKKVTKKLSRASFCSKFVSQVIKKAARESYLIDEYDDNMPSAVMPKHIEGKLYSHPYYDALLYTGNTNIFELMINRIREELGRVSKEVTQKEDWARIITHRILEMTILFLRSEKKMHDLDRTLILLKVIVPVLNMNIESELTDSNAYTNLIQYARERGIFLPRDIENVQIPFKIMPCIELDTQRLIDELDIIKRTVGFGIASKAA